MAAYVILDVTVTDPEAYETYKAGSTATLKAYGGKFLVRGGPHEVVEGNWKPGRVVVLEFESMERAREWYGSAEYAGPRTIRHGASTGNMIFVEGV